MDISAERAYATPLLNSTLLPMLLLSLATQKHTPKTSDEIDPEYDYIIVGGGSAGSVVASRLSEMPCLRVLLLEAGGPPPLLTDVPAFSEYFRGTDIDWNFKTVPQKYVGEGLMNRQLLYHSGKVLGGSSILNNMMYVRGNEKDYDQWAAEGAKGWNYEDVFPYFKKMEGNRDKNYIVNGFHGEDGPISVHTPRYRSELSDLLFKTIKSMGYNIIDPNGDKKTGFYDIQNTLRSGQRCSTAKAYLVPAENRTNLDILPYAMVRKVVIKNNQAIGVEFDYENHTYEVRARREVILSAGTIKTAQLLKLSGIGPRKELEKLRIPVVADLPVGYNFQDHPASFVNFLLNRDIPQMTKKLEDPDNVLQYIQNRTGPLTSAGLIGAAFLQNNVIDSKNDFPDYQLTFAESLTEFPAKVGLTRKYASQVYNPYKGRSFYTCFCSLLHPRSRGTVRLQSIDPYDSPLINPNYLEDPEDIKGLVEGMKTCLRVGKNPMMRNVGSIPFQTLIPGCEKHAENENSYLECAVKSAIFTFSHGVGTVRMGDPKDNRTVVDPNLKILHMKGLRVVDASIMPNIPSGSTYIPTIMIAEKASDIIKSTIECLEKPEDLLKEPANPHRFGDISDNTMQPYSEKQNNKHEAQRKKSSSSQTTKSRSDSYPIFEDSYDVPHKNQDYEWSKKLNEHELHSILSKVTPWNKEIPYVRPWNQEILNSNVLNVLTNQILSNNSNVLFPVNQQLLPPGIANNFPLSQLTNPLNNQQQSTQGIANLPLPQLINPLNNQQPSQGIANLPFTQNTATANSPLSQSTASANLPLSQFTNLLNNQQQSTQGIANLPLPQLTNSLNNQQSSQGIANLPLTQNTASVNPPLSQSTASANLPLSQRTASANLPLSQNTASANLPLSQSTASANLFLSQLQEAANLAQSQNTGSASLPQSETINSSQTPAALSFGSSQTSGNRPQKQTPAKLPQQQSLFNIPQLQTLLSNPQLQSLLNNFQQQTSDNILQAQTPNNLLQNGNSLQGQIPHNTVSSLEIKSNQPPPLTSTFHVGKSETQHLYFSPKKEKLNEQLSPWQSVWSHAQAHVLPWNKEVPNVTPWNQEILASNQLLPSSNNQPKSQTITANSNAVMPAISNTAQGSPASPGSVNVPQSQGPATSSSIQPQTPQESPQAQTNVTSQAVNEQQPPDILTQNLRQLQQSLETQIPLLAGRQQFMQSLLDIVQRMLNLLSSNSSTNSSSRRSEHSVSTKNDKEVCRLLLENMQCGEISCKNNKALSMYMHSQLCR